MPILWIKCPSFLEPTYALRPPPPPLKKKGTLENNVDPDQMPQNAMSDQGVHCMQ